MDNQKLKQLLECLLFVTNHPLNIAELADMIGESEELIRSALEEMKKDLENRQSAIQIAEVAEGVQFASRTGYGYWVKKLFKDQTTYRLSPSAFETLAIIAYKQPITRVEIEEIRGVDVSGVLETLFERKLVKIAGRKETVGRPLLYGTTQDFLRHFNLWKISDLPSLEDLAKEAERSAAKAEQQTPENNQREMIVLETRELSTAVEEKKELDETAK